MTLKGNSIAGLKKEFYTAGMVVLASYSLAAGAEIKLGPPFFNGRVMPTPQQVRYLDEFVTLYEDGGKTTTCILTDKAGSTDPAVNDLVSRMENLGGKIDIVFTEREAMGYKNILSVGKNSLSARYLKASKIQVPSQREGYVIQPVEEKGRQIIICEGRDILGLTWSMMSLIQLTTRENNKVLLKKASIYDYPYVRFRGGFGCSPAYKHNFVRGAWGPRTPDWRKDYPSEKWLDNMRASVKESRRYQVHPSVAFNPTQGLFGVEPTMESIPTISNPADMEILLNYIEEIVKAGGMPQPMWDDTGHHITPADIKRFGNLGNAHFFLATKMLERAKKVNPDAVIIFCPPMYFGSSLAFYNMDAKQYIETMRNLPQDVLIFWTGGDVVSRYVGEDLIKKWNGMWNRKTFYFENDWQWRQSDAKNFPSLYPDFFRHIEGYFISGSGDPGMIALADYLWNPTAYEPETSLKNAIEQLAGPKIYPVFKRWRELSDDMYKMRQLIGTVSYADDMLAEYNTEMKQLSGEITVNCPNKDFANFIAKQTVNDWNRVIRAQKTVAERVVPKMVSLENELFKLEIAPSEGGRINRWIDKKTGRNFLFTAFANPTAVYGDDQRAYTEFLTDGNSRAMRLGDMAYSIAQEGSAKTMVLSGEVEKEGDHFGVNRTMVLDGKTIRFKTEIKNLSSKNSVVRLRIHPEFGLPQLNTIDRYYLFTLKKPSVMESVCIEPSQGTFTFVGDDLPAGLWGIGDVKENWGIFDYFNSQDVASCFFFADWDPRLRNLETMSPFKELAPGETWTISHSYVFTDNLAEFLKKESGGK